MAKIFNCENFLNSSMIKIIEERGNMIDNIIYDEIEGIAKYEIKMPTILINKEKVKEWLILCGKLENIEHSELIDIATKKKFEEKNLKIKDLETRWQTLKTAIYDELEYFSDLILDKEMSTDVANGKYLLLHDLYNQIEELEKSGEIKDEHT